MADRAASPDEIHTLANLLAGQGVRHVFISGVAMGAWGVPRGTFDLDVAVSVREAELTRVLAVMSESGWVVDPVFQRGFRDRLAGMETIHVQLPVESTLITADIFLCSTPFLESVISRAVPVDIGFGPISVCSAADLVLLKLVAGRKKDMLDIQNVLTVQGIPERPYLERWADELSVRGRLEAALSERAGGP